MKSGMTRRLDDLGRIVLPKEMRTNLGLSEGNQMEIIADGNDIILRRHQVGCEICGSETGVANISFDRETETLKAAPDGVPLCRRCALLMADAFAGETE